MTNILLITADDMDGNTPGSFGGPVEATPNLDRLAAEGMVFRRGHVPAAVCQPSRSALMTGLWPHHNGAQGFEPINDRIAVINDLLKQAGYRTGILGKVDHLQPVERFAWDTAVNMRELGLGRNPTAYGSLAETFIAEATREGRPWFLMANAHDPHRPFHGSENEREKWTSEERELYPAPSKVFEADEVQVPGFLPDLPEVRTEYAQYLSSARRCDDVVGAVLEALERSGAAGNTMVVFLSDNGMAFPFAKANCYLRSTLTPLIIRWPGVATPGTSNADDLVNMLDLFPTFCDAAGVPTPAGLDGSSLLPLLLQREQERREQVFTVFHETAAKQRYEMRCVQDASYGYIWNAWADGQTQYRAENMFGLSWKAMLAAAEDDADTRQRADFYVSRAREELYDLASDPDCLRNRAAEPSLATVLAAKRDALARWMADTGDPLASTFWTEAVGELLGSGDK
ncbi:sulfatase family protein [Arthrobacter bambusae]|uniref:sulfatase family protein n=1 Tax=Arthrobacter bambusae TaxID=1338426 RepID=UPI0027872245|nr:sulfatase [Arthrobacter bambusae]MDQ0239505.1 N-sulfoglucosamine sulfohydrolase [Arthrobacter bambusae]